jgi:alcohol-forming fatty acyl-CoA reductase
MPKAKDGLGMSEEDREALIRDLNIIINCAGSTEFGSNLDSSVRVNVSGPLKLLQMAEQC